MLLSLLLLWEECVIQDKGRWSIHVSLFKHLSLL